MVGLILRPFEYNTKIYVGIRFVAVDLLDEIQLEGSYEVARRPRVQLAQLQLLALLRTGSKHLFSTHSSLFTPQQLSGYVADLQGDYRYDYSAHDASQFVAKIYGYVMCYCGAVTSARTQYRSRNRKFKDIEGSESDGDPTRQHGT